VNKNNNLFFGVRLYKLLAFLVFLTILAWLKIFLASKIYYNSKIVNDLQQDVSVLRAENDMLKQDIEALKFKTQVSDVIIKSSLESDVLIRLDN
jgi:cell division protein FtsL